MHARLYGLEDEYLNGTVDKPETKSPPIFVKDIFSDHNLAVGDRLSLAYDLATHSCFYYIIKELVGSEMWPNEISDKTIAMQTDTAAVVRSHEDTSNTTPTTHTTTTSNPEERTKREPSTNEEVATESGESNTSFDDVLETFSDQLNPN